MCSYFIYIVLAACRWLPLFSVIIWDTRIQMSAWCIQVSIFLFRIQYNIIYHKCTEGIYLEALGGWIPHLCVQYVGWRAVTLWLTELRCIFRIRHDHAFAWLSLITSGSTNEHSVTTAAQRKSTGLICIDECMTRLCVRTPITLGDRRQGSQSPQW